MIPVVAEGFAVAQQTVRKGAGLRSSLQGVLVEVDQLTNLSWLKGRIIGKDGVNIRNIREETGVRVVVETDSNMPGSGKARLIGNLTSATAGAALNHALNLLKGYVSSALAEERSIQHERVLRRRTLRRQRTSDLACFLQADGIEDLSWFKGRLIGKQGINLQSIAWETGVKFDLSESSNGRRGLEARFKSRDSASFTGSSIKAAIGMLENFASKAKQEEAAWRRRKDAVNGITDSDLPCHLTIDTASFPKLSVSEAISREPTSPRGWESKLAPAVGAESTTTCDISEQAQAEGGYRMWLHLDRAVPKHLQFLIRAQNEVDLACFMNRIGGRDMRNMKRISDATGVHIRIRELAESTNKAAALQITMDWESEHALTTDAIEMLKDAVAKAWGQLAPGKPGWRMPVTSTERDRQWSLHQAEDRRQCLERTKCRWFISSNFPSREHIQSVNSDDAGDYTSDEGDAQSLMGKDEDEYDASSEADCPMKEHAGNQGRVRTRDLKALAPISHEVQGDVDTGTSAETSMRIIHQRVIRSADGAPLLPPWLQKHSGNRWQRTCKVLKLSKMDSCPNSSENELPFTSHAECACEPNITEELCTGVEAASTEASEGEETEDVSHCGDVFFGTSSCMSLPSPEIGDRQLVLDRWGKQCDTPFQTDDEQDDVPSGTEVPKDTSFQTDGEQEDVQGGAEAPKDTTFQTDDEKEDVLGGTEESVACAGCNEKWRDYTQPKTDFSHAQPHQMSCQTGEGWTGNTLAWQMVPVIPVLYFVTPAYEYVNAQAPQPAPSAAAILPLERNECPNCNAISVKWRLNAKDLRGKNNRSPTRMLSPSFDLSFGDSLE
jgi:transcription antitermination factor NusA-like protein